MRDDTLPDRLLTAVYSVLPIINFLLLLVRWLDSYRIATDVELPLPVSWRVLLARYNLLAVSTHIYRGLRAIGKPPNSS